MKNTTIFCPLYIWRIEWSTQFFGEVPLSLALGSEQVGLRPWLTIFPHSCSTFHNCKSQSSYLNFSGKTTFLCATWLFLSLYRFFSQQSLILRYVFYKELSSSIFQSLWVRQSPLFSIYKGIYAYMPYSDQSRINQCHQVPTNLCYTKLAQYISSQYRNAQLSHLDSGRLWSSLNPAPPRSPPCPDCPVLARSI